MSKNSKSWRQDSRITDLKATVFNKQPFGVVAVIPVDSEQVAVGISRCNPNDQFNFAAGEEIASGRARLEFATFLGLIAPDRTSRLRTKTEQRKSGLPTQMIISRKHFARVFGVEESALPNTPSEKVVKKAAAKKATAKKPIKTSKPVKTTKVATKAKKILKKTK